MVILFILKKGSEIMYLGGKIRKIIRKEIDHQIKYYCPYGGEELHYCKKGENYENNKTKKIYF